MADRSVFDGDLGSGLEGGDLFELATALADLLDAPVTIEDRDTRVLAYSEGQQSVDAARTATILGRRVPEEYLSALRAAGVFERIARQPGVVYADLADAGMKPRAIVGIRADHELIGSVWAAVEAPPTAEQEQALLDAVPVVAEQMMLDRSRRDVVRRTRGELMSTVLHGGARSREAAARLGIGEGAVVVAALRVGEEAPVAERMSEERLGEAVALHLRAVEARSLCAVVDGTVYCLSHARPDEVRRLLAEVAEGRAGREAGVRVGIGRRVEAVDDAHRSRHDADAVLAVLAARPDGPALATIDEVFLDLLALRVADLLEAEDLLGLGPLPALRRSDREHGTRLEESAAAYLDAGGDVRTAAERLHVHPNTLRNRVRRAVDLCAVDLDDPDTRLALMLQLRAGRLHTPEA